MIKGFLNAGLSNIMASTKTASSAELLQKLGISVTLDNHSLAKACDVIIVALKPFNVLDELKNLAACLKGKVIISVAALIPLKAYNSVIKDAEIYRAMPNICVEINKGFIPLTGEKGDNHKLVENIMKLLGEVTWVSEEMLDKLTLFSASTPALVAELMDAFYLAAMEIGITQQLASAAIVSVFAGVAELYRAEEVTAIRNKVITPKGTTIKLLLETQRRNVKLSIQESIIKASSLLEALLEKFR